MIVATLLRKPLEGTVAANTLKWGCGALNIDACRVPMTDADKARIEQMGGFGKAGWQGQPGVALEGSLDGTLNRKAEDFHAHPAGRWPANVVLLGQAGSAEAERYFLRIDLPPECETAATE